MKVRVEDATILEPITMYDMRKINIDDVGNVTMTREDGKKFRFKFSDFVNMSITEVK